MYETLKYKDSNLETYFRDVGEMRKREINKMMSFIISTEIQCKKKLDNCK